ncbi:MAG TPA: low affinity iron permease family protein [Thermoanaerobaculia bacterium]|nr:low affinity iron permease family protein [Thermoanaerobaculia bacterium]
MAKDRSSKFATRVSQYAGSSWAFIIALLIVAVWAATGPIFHYSDTWQLVINTGTTVVTFLMVFLIQRAQNRDTLAVQLKLNELVAAIDAANNRLISVEDLSEEELDVLHVHYRKLAALAKDEKLADTHSEEQATVRHRHKRQHRHRQ